MLWENGIRNQVIGFPWPEKLELGDWKSKVRNEKLEIAKTKWRSLVPPAF